MRNGKRVRAHTRTVTGGTQRARHFDFHAFHPVAEEYAALMTQDLRTSQREIRAKPSFRHEFPQQTMVTKKGAVLTMHRDPLGRNLVRVRKMTLPDGKKVSFGTATKSKVAGTHKSRATPKQPPRRAGRKQVVKKAGLKAKTLPKKTKRALVGRGAIEVRPTTEVRAFRHARTRQLPLRVRHPRAARGLTLKRSKV